MQTYFEKIWKKFTDLKIWREEKLYGDNNT